MNLLVIVLKVELTLASSSMAIFYYLGNPLIKIVYNLK